MRSVGTARRRAEEFASLVESPAAGRTASSDRYAPLLEVVGALRESPAPVARPEFVTGLRERLMAEATTALATTPATPGSDARTDAEARDRLRLPARNRRHERRLAAVVGGIVLVGTTASVAAAAQGSLPGDTLYPIKRAIEQAHTGISLDSSDKGATLLSSARARLGEVEQLTGSGSTDSVDASAVAGTLGTFADQATEGSDLLLSEYDAHGDQDSISAIHDFAAESLDRITALEPTVPDDARDELVHAAQVVVSLDATAQQACPSCGGPAIGEIPPIFVASATHAPAAVTHPATAPEDTTAGSPRGPHHKHHQRTPSSQPAQPGVGADALPSGGVESAPSPDLPSPSTSVSDPLGALTGTLTDTLNGALGGGDQNGDTSGKNAKGGNAGNTGKDGGKDRTTDGVGGVVDGLGDTVDGLLGGVTGSLLGGQDRTGR